MHIDWWTLGLQTVNLLVLLWLLQRFLFKPVMAMIASRQAQAARLLADAEAERRQAEEARRQAEAQTADLARQRQDMLAAIATEVAAQKDALLAAARQEAEAVRAAATQQAADAQARQEARLAARASALAVTIAGRLLDRLPASARVDGFLPGLTDGIAALAPGVRESVAAADAPLRLTVARPLEAAEADAVRTALATALGRPVTVETTVDPGVLAGFEIETPYVVVRNSLRADLEVIAAALGESGDDR